MRLSVFWLAGLLVGALAAQPAVYVPYREGKLWGYRTPKGAVLISPRFAEAGPFSEGYASVRSSFPMGGSGWGVIGTNASWVLLPIFENLYDVNEGCLLAQSGGRWGLMALNGQWKIEPRFKDVWPYTEGLARVESYGRWGFLDLRGRFVIDCLFEEPWFFNEALGDSAVKPGADGVLHPVSGGRFQRRQPSGPVVHTGFFSEGLALVKDAIGYAIIDRNGNLKNLVVP
ncbi:MAG: WG repeat-containing protein [Spirochaetes bacterium]|nr:WG repeat-containing protein [Spirochaetota bacterium]